MRCPEPQKLAAYAHGDLTDPAASEIADHVEQCDRCEATVVNLERRGDTVISGLRKKPAADPLLDEPQCQRAVNLVRELGRDPATVDLAPNATLSSSPAAELGQLREYKLLEKLGEGGMGAVYKALHTKLKRIVALKVLPADRLQDPQAVTRFEREMEAVGKLDHPHIVRAMDAGEFNGTHFLVMEYVDGIDLSQLVSQRGPLPIDEACEYVRQAAIGLQHAHEHGLVHRDIKPSNIILASGERKLPKSAPHQAATSSEMAAHNQGAYAPRSPTVKILDLGLALLGDKHDESPQRELTSTGQMMGTLDYMAPEQGSDSHVVDIRADIYSLGATLFKLLTGDVVYSGAQFRSPMQKMTALAIAPAPDIRTRRPDVPESLAGIVARMLEKDPAKRPSTPAEVVALLTPFAQATNVKPPIAKDPAAKPAITPRLETPPVIAVKPQPPAKPQVAALSPARGNAPPWVLIGGLLALAGLGAVGLAATVFYFQTDNGTLRVEVQGRETEVRVQGTDIVITAEGEREPIKLQAGEHSLVVTRGDFSFETDKFELKRGEKTTVKVELLDGLVKVVRDGEVIGEQREPGVGPAIVGKWTTSTSPEMTHSATKIMFLESGEYQISGPFELEGQLVHVEINGKKQIAPFNGSGTWELNGDDLRVQITTANVQGWKGKPSIYKILEHTQRKLVLETEGERLALFRANEPSSSPGVIKTFAADTPTIDKEGIAPEDGGWKIVATGDRTARLFEIDRPGVDNCMIFYSAKIKTKDVGKRAYLEMWCRFAEGSGDAPAGEYFSKGFHNAASGTSDWASVEIPFRLEKGQSPDLIKLNVVIEGGGTVWIKDVELLRYPSPAAAGATPLAIAPFDAPQARVHQQAWAKQLGVPVEWTNGLGMKFVLIPPGEYLMGSPREEVEASVRDVQAHNPDDKRWLQLVQSESPQHKIRLTQPFYLGVYEVTQKQYADVMGANPALFAKTGKAPEFVEKVAGLDTANFAVENVSWNDAAEFCAKLSEREKYQPVYFRAENTVTQLAGDGYRLPTEAQWEFACRAGTTTKRWCGDGGERELTPAGWFWTNANQRMHAVGELRPNPFGLYDIYGNAAEFVADAWAPDYYDRLASETTIDPAGAPPGEEERIDRVIRGGLWQSGALQCRSASRFANDGRAGNQHVGFRVALPVEAVRRVLSPDALATRELNEAQDSWTPLFNGKDLGGWSKLWTHDSWAVEDGLLVGKSPPNQLLSERDDYGDFHLRAEVKINQAGNSGVFFRCQPSDTVPRSGYEVEIAVEGDNATGSVMQYPEEPWVLFQEKTKRLAPDKWCVVEIIAQGERLITKVDGEPCAVVRNDKYRRGRIELQVFGGETRVEFRKIEVRELAPAPKIVHARSYEGHTAAVTQAIFSPDGKSIFTASHDQSVRQFDRHTKRQLKEIGKHTGWVWGLDISRDGKQLISASEDRTIRLWDLTDGSARTYTGHGGTITSVTFFDGDRRAISTSWDHTVRIWDLANMKNTTTFTGHTEPVWDVAVTRDGKHAVSGGADGTLRIWDLEKLKHERTIDAHDNIIGFLEVSPDGTRIVSGAHDGTLRVWNLATGERISSIEGPREKMQGVAFSPDSNTIASIDYASVVRLTDAATGKELARFAGPKAIGANIVFSADGEYLLAGNHSGEAMLLQIIDGIAASNASTADAKAYDRFATGRWTPVLNIAGKITKTPGLAFADGVITLDDEFARDEEVQATDMIARAQVKGMGSLNNRCTGGNYGFWLGEGFVGINRNDNAGTTVLAARAYSVDLTQFHELALATVGDRQIAFVDGRRVLDTADDKWQVRGPLLLHANKTKSEFKNVEVMSLDGLDAAKLLPERDPLAKWVGVWDTEWTHTNVGKPPVKLKGVMVIERAALGDFYQAISNAEDGSSSLFVYKYLPDADAIRTWTFFSNGRYDVFDKQIDPATGDHLVPSRALGRNIESGGMRLLDNDTAEAYFITKSPAGDVVRESRGIQKRRDEHTPVERPTIAAAGPAENAPEIAVLGPLAGQWDVEVKVLPTKYSPAGSTEKMHDEIRWVLGGRFLMGEGYNADGKLANIWLWGFDPAGKTYPMQMFQRSGDTPLWTNVWDPKTRSLAGSAQGLPEGWPGEGGNRVISDDEVQAWATLKNDRGEVLYSMQATKRRAPSDSAPLDRPAEPSPE